MRRRLPLAALAALLLLPATPAFAGDPIMPLSQVRSGMQCTGYSVVRGTDISSFRVDVLDVVDGDPAENGPRILVQASGPAVDATGIGPGFSGSPIYCRDAQGTSRNIGAISESIGEYGGKVVLATPIEAILANPVDAPRERPATRTSSASRRTVKGAIAARAAAARARMRRDGVKPLASPLVVTGLSRGLGRAFEAAGRRVGRPVQASPAGPLGSFPVQTMRPGSAVSVGYSSGDLRLGAIGTVAYTDGPSVWAFGHPFEASGARALFLQDAYVYRVINDPNTSSETGGSYKLASPGHDIGTLTNDALDAVVGRTGVLPASIPIRVAARDVDTNRSFVMHVTAADETDAGNTTGFSPVGSVAPLAIAQAGSSVMRSAPGRLTGRMCLTIAFREAKRRARFCNRYVTSSSVGAEEFGGGNAVSINAALDALDALGLVDTFAGRPPHVTKVSARLQLERGERVADLLAVRAPRVVHPGEKIRVRARMQRLRGPRITRSYKFRVPQDIRPGRRRLTLTSGDVTSGDELDFFEELLFGEDTNDLGPTTLNGLIKAIRDLGRFDGVSGKIGSERFRAFTDKRLFIAGKASTPVRVKRR